MTTHVTNQYARTCHCAHHTDGHRVAAGAGIAVLDPGSDHWIVQCTDSGGDDQTRCSCGKPAVFSALTWGDLCRGCCNRAGIIPELWR